MQVSKIESLEAFKIFTGLDVINSDSFFYCLPQNKNYIEVYNLLVGIISDYGFISAIGFGEENNPHNINQLILEKKGYFGQYGYNNFSQKSVNYKIIDNGKRIFFSHYIGKLSDIKTFYSLIKNKVDRIFLELVNDDENREIILKNDYIGVKNESSIRILFGFDLEENLYLIFSGNSISLQKVRDLINSRNTFSSVGNHKLLDRVVYVEKNIAFLNSIFMKLKK